jgi:hypothetical protein
MTALLLVSPAACTSADSGSSPPPATPTGNERDTEIKHEPCDANGSGAQKIDANGDGRPDIVHVMDKGREVCRIVDLNLDGQIDTFIYYDTAGRERRREADFDRDGRPDEIAHFQDGMLVLKERETNYDDKLDTWDHYEGGRLVKRERDSDGDGLVDQWWSFQDPAHPECAVVASDRNVDGKPDPDNVTDLCAEGRPTGGHSAVPAGSTSAAPPASSAAPPAAAPPTAPAPPPPNGPPKSPG